MSNFLNWLAKTLPEDEIEVFLNMNNIIPEKAELFLDIVLSLHKIIINTYLGDFEHKETRLIYNEDDIEKHFDWSWGKLMSDFSKEGIIINKEGDHKEYFKLFFLDSFYNQNSTVVRDSIEGFFQSIFDISAARSKADLDILAELYKMINNNISFDVEKEMNKS